MLLWLVATKSHLDIAAAPWIRPSSCSAAPPHNDREGGVTAHGTTRGQAYAMVFLI